MFNTARAFGLVAIILHWVMAITIFSMFALGWYMVELTYYDALYKTLPEIHKSIGILLAAVLVFRLVWRMTNITPMSENSTSSFERLAVKVVHLSFYFLMVLIVVSGYLISTADASGISVFDFFQVPATITSIPQQEDIAGLVHKYLAYTIIGLAVLHASAALKHHFINKDDTLRKMLGI